MVIKEKRREVMSNGETIIEYETGKLLVRLINTYNDRQRLDDLLYEIGCYRLTKGVA